MLAAALCMFICTEMLPWSFLHALLLSGIKLTNGCGFMCCNQNLGNAVHDLFRSK